MLSNTFEVKSSKYFALFFTGLHLLAAAAVFVSAVAIYIKFVLLLLVAISFYFCISRYICLRYGYSIVKFWQQNGIWYLQTRAQEIKQASLEGDSVVSAGLLILTFKIKNKLLPQSVVIFRDSLSSTQFRHLKVMLLTSKWSS